MEIVVHVSGPYNFELGLCESPEIHCTYVRVAKPKLCLSHPPLNKSECLATEIISASKILTSDDEVQSISTSSVQISEKVRKKTFYSHNSSKYKIDVEYGNIQYQTATRDVAKPGFTFEEWIHNGGSTATTGKFAKTKSVTASFTWSITEGEFMAHEW